MKEKIYNSLTELIGRTPLLALNRLTAFHQTQARLIAKLEYFNPGGSVKDRIALAMIEDAEKRDTLHPGSTIIEPTSGNTGIGLAWIGALKGYKVILVMSELMSVERQKLLRALGAEVVLTPGSEGMNGAIRKANELLQQIPNAIQPGQFDNPANPQTHALTTAREIWEDTAGKVDVFVAGAGTGGTVSGVSKGLKLYNPAIEIVAVEPAASPVLSGGKAGSHMIQGIGAGFVPTTYNPQAVDRIIRVSDEDAVKACRELALREGLLTGFSSGAAVHAALQLAQSPEYADKNIVVLLPDSGERYLSTSLYENESHQ